MQWDIFYDHKFTFLQDRKVAISGAEHNALALSLPTNIKFSCNESWLASGHACIGVQQSFLTCRLQLALSLNLTRSFPG